MVKDNLGRDPRVIRANLLSKRINKQHKSDEVVRSVLRHSYSKTAKVLLKIIDQKLG